MKDRVILKIKEQMIIIKSMKNMPRKKCMIMIKERKNKLLEDKQMKDKFVEQDKELVVLVLMKVVLQRHQFVQNMDIVNVLHINLEVLNVVLDLEIMLEDRDKLEEDK